MQKSVVSNGVGPLQGKTVLAVSRCAWTRFNFRLPLLCALMQAGARVIALEAGDNGYESRLLAAIFGTIAARLCRVPARAVTITGLGFRLPLTRGYAR